MKLRAGTRTYPLHKAIGLISTVEVSDGPLSVSFCVMRVEPETLQRMQKDNPERKGLPTHFCLMDFNKTIAVHPCPDAVYDLRIRYFPPMEEQ